PKDKATIFAELQSKILQLQGLKCESNPRLDLGLGIINDSFPNGSFPTAAVHEFLCGAIEDTAASSGFVAGLLSSLTGDNGAVVWISSARRLFPPALKAFNIDPERFIFVDLKKEVDVLWAMDEALKCDAVSAVVGEMNDLGFTQSRRLQLAVEQSK